MNAITSKNGDKTEHHTVLVIPRGRTAGFRASVRGHILDLVDPSAYSLAPTSDDLFIVSIAAALAWCAQRFLRARELPDYVSVSATWRAHTDSQTPAEITVAVTVLRRTEAASAELASCLEKCLSARALAKPDIRISLGE